MPRPSPPSANEVVTVSRGDMTLRLPRSLGLVYLAELVANPGIDVPALQLAASTTPRPTPRPSSGPNPDKTGAPRRPDPLLDRPALAAYRNRLAELDEEIAEASSWNDIERRARLESERDFLVVELTGAVGLSGRQRRFPDEAERARVNVTRALRSAIRRVGKTEPALARTLDNAVTTGSRCRFDPPTDEAGSAPVET